MSQNLRVLCTILVIGVGGCTQTLVGPNLGGIYDRSAAYHHASRNPVIVIPGILGSRLVDSDTNRVVWGSFAGDYANPQTPDGARLFALPMREDVALLDLGDGVQPDGVLDRVEVRLFGLPIESNAYLHILATLGVGGYRDEELGEANAIDYGEDHYTCFQFPYDWRRDLVESAKRLHEFVMSKRAYVQAEYAHRYGIENADVKFDLVAHSMGGLVARYYLRYGAADLPEDGSTLQVTWEGARYVERVVIVGTPNAGSLKALLELVDGAKFSAVLPKYEAAVLGTMPAVYQLLPRGRHGPVVNADAPYERVENILDPQLWTSLNWGLASPEQDRVLAMLLPDTPSADTRRQIALDHQRKCLQRAAQFTAALDSPATPPDGLSLHLFAGDAEPTRAVATASRRTGALRVVDWKPGDGTVLRSSAVMDERLGRPWTPSVISPISWSQVTFVFNDHLGMTRDPVFTDNALYLLLEQPR